MVAERSLAFLEKDQKTDHFFWLKDTLKQKNAGIFMTLL